MFEKLDSHLQEYLKKKQTKNKKILSANMPGVLETELVAIAL